MDLDVSGIKVDVVAVASCTISGGVQVKDSSFLSISIQIHKHYAFDSDNFEFVYFVSMVLFHLRNSVIGVQEGIMTINP